MYQTSLDKNFIRQNDTAKIATGRVTALWAFSEAALGGILHALKIPFTGLFIGGAAVVFIALIAHLSTNKNAVLKSTLIVIIVKAAVSPYTPVNAFFAVALQGFLGYLFFFSKNYFKTKALILGIITSFLSGFQKIIILTLLFGVTLWESIDIFADYVFGQLGFTGYEGSLFSLSLILIGSYIFLHLAGGITFGILAAKVPEWLKEKSKERNIFLESKNDVGNLNDKKKVGRKNRWKRKSVSVVLIFSFLMIILSYYIPDLDNNIIIKILSMLVRSIFIMVVWTFLISPVLLKYLNKFLKKRKSKYSGEVEEIILLFPFFKAYLKQIMTEAKNLSGLKKIKFILSNSFYTLLTSDIKH